MTNQTILAKSRKRDVFSLFRLLFQLLTYTPRLVYQSFKTPILMTMQSWR
nr:MAG TPA: hypothetical protein [Caudoviricetes sp.]